VFIIFSYNCIKINEWKLIWDICHWYILSKKHCFFECRYNRLKTSCYFICNVCSYTLKSHIITNFIWGFIYNTIVCVFCALSYYCLLHFFLYLKNIIASKLFNRSHCILLIQSIYNLSSVIMDSCLLSQLQPI